jgi:UDP-N-acetylmuramate--alanine ligase
MCSAVFSAADADPTVMCGSVLSDVKSTFKLGGGDHFIFEACEYMDSFLDFNPTAAVVLNVEMDHVDYFHSIDQMMESYAKFVKKTGERGTVIYNADDKTAVASVSDFGGRRISFGIESDNAFFRATEIESTDTGSKFTVLKEGEEYARVSLSVPGRHNVLNALAATAAGYYGGVAAEDIVKGLGEYRGTHRRIEYKGRLDGARIYDDYAHHPTEITASLGALRTLMKGKGRLSVVFQSHTYSRTKALEDEFASALSLADRVIVAPIFPARETDTLGVSQYTLAAKVSGGVAAESLEDAARKLTCDLSESDVAVVMGAGNVDSIFAMLGDRLKP